MRTLELRTWGDVRRGMVVFYNDRLWRVVARERGRSILTLHKYSLVLVGSPERMPVTSYAYQYPAQPAAILKEEEAMPEAETCMRVSAVGKKDSFVIARCCELPTPIPSRRPGLNLTISCNNCGAMLLHMDMEEK